MNARADAGALAGIHGWRWQDDDVHVPFQRWQKLECLSLSNMTSEVLWLDLISSYVGLSQSLSFT